MRLALVDNNSTNLSAAASTLGSSSSSSDVKTYNIDVSQSSQWRDLRTKVEKDFGSVDFLMLNAGIGLKWDSGEWENEEYWQKTLNTNLFGVINGISAFLPMLRTEKGGREKAIVMTGSKQGTFIIHLTSKSMTYQERDIIDTHF